MFNLRSITAHIWFPFAGLVLILGLFLATYYPQLQRELIEEHEGHELRELARTVALGIEISLDMNNFAGLQRSVDYISDRDDLDGVIVLSDDSTDPIAQMDQGLTFAELERKREQYIVAEQRFVSESFGGVVLIAMDRDKVEARVSDINRPIYLLLVLSLALTIVGFYLVARQVSEPILEAVSFARALETGDYRTTISLKGKDEIGQLRRSLTELRDTLREQREQNLELTSGLEQKVRHRTAELRAALSELYAAQRIGRMGGYSYFRDGRFEYSANLGELLGLGGQGGMDVSRLDELVLSKEVKLSERLNGLTLEHRFLSFDFQMLLPSSDASVWLTITAELIPADDVHDEPRISGTIQDISERKATEERLNQLSMVARLTTNGVIITDRDKRIIWVNDALLRLTGYAWDEVIGQRPGMFQFEGTDVTTSRLISEKLENGESVIAEILNRSKQGREYWLELHIQPYHDISGQLVGFLAVEVDITERKRDRDALMRNLAELEQSRQEVAEMNSVLEQRVSERTAQLSESLDRVQTLQQSIVHQERLASLGQLIAGIAHEVNSPLGAITASGANLAFGIKQLLSSELHNIHPDILHHACDFAAAQVHTLTLSTLEQRALVAELRDHLQQSYNLDSTAARYARMLVDCGVSAKDTVLLDTIFNQDDPQKALEVVTRILRLRMSVDTIGLAAAQAGTVIGALKRQVHFDSANSMADIPVRRSLETVLILFRNQMRSGVKVEMNVPEGLLVSANESSLAQVWSNLISNALQAMGGRGLITVDHKVLEQFVVVSISNNGPMIPERTLERIFEPFYTTKKIGEGTGMGLSIVRDIVRTHGGDIWAYSDPQITSFHVKLPKPWR